MLDLFNDKVVSVDYNRDQGFLTGMGIDTKDKAKNGDEATTGKYTGGKGGDYTIVCNEPTQGAQDGGKTAMENCLSKTKDINVVYTINEPAAAGAVEALQAAGIKDALVVSVDGGCSPGIAIGQGRHHRGHLAAVPAEDGAEMGVEAIKKMVDSNGCRQAGRTRLDWTSTTPESRWSPTSRCKAWRASRRPMPKRSAGAGSSS